MMMKRNDGVLIFADNWATRLWLAMCMPTYVNVGWIWMHSKLQMVRRDLAIKLLRPNSRRHGYIDVNFAYCLVPFIDDSSLVNELVTF